MIDFIQLLEGLQIKLTPFAVCELLEGSGLKLGETEQPTIHYILEGRGLARRPGRKDVPLEPHTIVILPREPDMVMACPKDSRIAFPTPRCRPIPGGWEWIQIGDGDPGLVMACALLTATHQGLTGLFDFMHEPIIENMAEEPAFSDAMELLLKELAWPKPGTPALASILMKQCLIILLRRFWQEDGSRAPWLAAIDQPQLGKAITAMADDPEKPFTLQKLAEIAGMSRSSFAERFKSTFGRSAMAHLKEARLQRAAQLLATTDLPIKMVAGRVGFESRSHFTRAFKTFANVHPSEYRLSLRPRTRL